MAGLRVPIVTILAGEGGSGGALGIGMGNVVGMLSGGYFGVISPEGAASILGRYKDDADKALRFPAHCQELAKAQCIYADQLQSIGVVDEIIWEQSAATSAPETFQSFPVLKRRIFDFLKRSLVSLTSMSPSELVAQRYTKYRKMGTFALIESEDARKVAVQQAKDSVKTPAKKGTSTASQKSSESSPLPQVLRFIAEETVCGNSSRYRGNMGGTGKCPEVAPDAPPAGPAANSDFVNAKKVLDNSGPEAMAQWVRSHSKVSAILCQFRWTCLIATLLYKDSVDGHHYA